MKSHFGWYYRPTHEEFKKLWSEGTFIFDTNVLLNLYRYPHQLREVFLSVVEKIGERIWIPYHVGLEFHRNKFTRIKQENAKVKEIIDSIESGGESIVSNVKSLTLNNISAGLDISAVQPHIDQLLLAHKKIIEVVSASRSNLPQCDLDDPIGIRVLDLFAGKVGDPPKSQEELEKMLEDSEVRFENKIPPGFKDKNPKDESVFCDGKILYKNKYGDLIIWKQAIDYARSGHDKIIFITDDSKTDWWDVDGGETRGPLPALLREMHTEGNVDLFWIYKSDQFLRFAEEYLQAHEVTQEAILQAKDISENSLVVQDLENLPHAEFIHLRNPTEFKERRPVEARWSPYSNPSAWRHERFELELAVERWLTHRYGECVRSTTKRFPTYIVEGGVAPIGVVVKYVKNLARIPIFGRIEELMLRVYKSIVEGDMSAFVIILVLDPDDISQLGTRTLERLCSLMESNRVSAIVIGTVDFPEFNEMLTLGDLPRTRR